MVARGLQCAAASTPIHHTSIPAANRGLPPSTGGIGGSLARAEEICCKISAPPGTGNGTAELTSLPEAPASRYTAFAVHCRDEGEVCEALAWYGTVLESRPGTPLGLVARATDCIQPVADLDRSLVFVMDPSRLNGGGLPGTAAGGTLQRAARDLDVHPNTLARWLEAARLSPRPLRQKVRITAYELRVEQGMERTGALVAGGWTDHEERRQTLARLTLSFRISAIANTVPTTSVALGATLS
jgi:transposase-like protein